MGGACWAWTGTWAWAGSVSPPVLLPPVYVMLSCTFKYGRQDVDVMGVAFRRDLFVVTRQVYPPLLDKQQLTHTEVQKRLLYKLGQHAYPFYLEVSGPDRDQDQDRDSSLCASVSRQPALLGGSAAGTF